MRTSCRSSYIQRFDSPHQTKPEWQTRLALTDPNLCFQWTLRHWHLGHHHCLSPLTVWMSGCDLEKLILSMNQKKHTKWEYRSLVPFSYCWWSTRGGGLNLYWDGGGGASSSSSWLPDSSITWREFFSGFHVNNCIFTVQSWDLLVDLLRFADIGSWTVGERSHLVRDCLLWSCSHTSPMSISRNITALPQVMCTYQDFPKLGPLPCVVLGFGKFNLALWILLLTYGMKRTATLKFW
jgi:hypothetical protein